jgi:anti-anti-sigma factor
MSAGAVPLYEPFTVAVVPDRAEVAVVPVGELDMATRPELEREVRQLLDVGFRRIVIDLRRVQFLDSTTLRFLLELRDRAEPEGYKLILVPGSPAVQRAFEVTGTFQLFAWRDH